MPIYEYKCLECGRVSEILVFSSASKVSGPEVSCPGCGSTSMEKLMSATSSLTGRSSSASRLPGPKDTACCGSRPGEAAGCAGPGSCCGKIG